jgi:hypothetical protein
MKRRMKIKNLSIFASLLNEFAIYCPKKMVATFENKTSGIFQSNETVKKKSQNYRLL